MTMRHLMRFAAIALLGSMLCTSTTTLLAQKVDSKQKPEPAGGAGQDNSDNDPLERTIQSMRDVHKRIAGRDIGAKTQKIQRQILDDLEALIKLAKQQQASSNSSQRQPMQKSSKKRDPNSQPGKKKGSRKGKTNQEKTDKAKNSSKKTRDAKAKKAAADRAYRQALIREIWGHLPERTRQKMLNILNEKPLLKYEDLVRRYWQALAESGGKSR